MQTNKTASRVLTQGLWPWRLTWICIAAATLVHADERTRKLAARLPEEAALFAREATKYSSEETLTQHAVVDRVVVNGIRKEVVKDKVIVSRYGFVSFREAPETLREMRQIESVDGKRAKAERSLKAVATAVTASDERQKRKLMEDFEKAGLLGVATNLGQLLLLFSGTKVQNYDFSFQSEKFAGADRVMVFSYAQTEGGGMTTYRGKDTMRSKLSGEIWVDGDYRPLKVTLNSTVEAPDKKMIRQEMEVRYAPTLFPCVLPTYARHRELHDGAVEVVNEYQYAAFRPWEEAGN